MLQFVCDYCGVVKEPAETWINGVAAENVGTQAARREVIIDPAWRRDRAVVPLGVHFCSIECKDNYLAEMFNQPTSLLEVRSATLQSDGTRVVHARKMPVVKTKVVRATGSKRTRGR